MRGLLRGNPVEWDPKSEVWRYEDGTDATGSPRPCVGCGLAPTPDGHDACIANIPGAQGGCCGHGVHVGYINWPDISAPPGWRNGAYITEE